MNHSDMVLMMDELDALGVDMSDSGLKIPLSSNLDSFFPGESWETCCYATLWAFLRRDRVLPAEIMNRIFLGPVTKWTRIMMAGE
jgi:hypothetical protein